MGGSARGLFEKRRGKRMGEEVTEVGEEDSPASRVERDVIQTPVRGGARGQKRMQRGAWEA